MKQEIPHHLFATLLALNPVLYSPEFRGEMEWSLGSPLLGPQATADAGETPCFPIPESPLKKKKFSPGPFFSVE